MEAQINHELEHGHYKIVQQKPHIISALGSITKKQSNKVCLIHDCSHPTGAAVADYANPDKFSYQTLQDAIDHITSWMDG